MIEGARQLMAGTEEAGLFQAEVEGARVRSTASCYGLRSMMQLMVVRCGSRIQRNEGAQRLRL